MKAELNRFYYIYAVLQKKSYIFTYQDNLSNKYHESHFWKAFRSMQESERLLQMCIYTMNSLLTRLKSAWLSRLTRKITPFSKWNSRKTAKKPWKIQSLLTNISASAVFRSDIINGKSAVEWIMERYAVIINKKSGIIDTPNDYGDEKYIFNLLISVILVSLKTLELIDSMPEYTEI